LQRTGESRSAGLDALRALAALTVAFAHSLLVYFGDNNSLALQTVFTSAAYAVDLFFVLSGFLVGRILLDVTERSSAAIANFAWRRLLRTVPNYLLFLLLNIIVWKWVYNTFPEHGRYWVFAQNLFTPQPMFFVESWSLAVEEWFYALIAIAALLLHRAGPSARRWFAILLLLVLSVIAARIAIATTQSVGWDLGLRKMTVARLDGLAYGMLVALALRYLVLQQSMRVTLCAAGCVAIGLAYVLPAQIDIEKSMALQVVLPTLTGLGFAALLPMASAWHYTAGQARLPASILKWLANISYALYLTNLLSYRVLEWGLKLVSEGTVSQHQFVLLNMACSITLAALCFRFFEQPILRWRDRRFPSAKDSR
jgi:peptidoglycan/LPS O-acetylase OafA/YrhL